MLLSAELELAGLILVLYVQDAVLLLHSNEGVLTYSTNGQWKLGLGATSTRVMGKNVYVPNLFTVHRPHYRMPWSFEAEETNASASTQHTVKQRIPKASLGVPSQWSPQVELFQGLGRLALLMGFFQLVAFPAVMFLYQTDVSVIAVLVAIYSTVLLALALVKSRMDAFGLSSKKFAALCFECLLCPPIAINLVRRLSLDMCKSADLVAVAETLVTPYAWAAAQLALGRRIEDQMSLEPEESKRYLALQRRLEALSSKQRNFDEHQ